MTDEQQAGLTDAQKARIVEALFEGKVVSKCQGYGTAGCGRVIIVKPAKSTFGQMCSSCWTKKCMSDYGVEDV